MRAAIAGCGNIAGVHAECLSTQEGVALTAFADPVTERAKALQRRYGGHCYASLEEMLAQEQIDVLHVCTPHHLHVPMICRSVTQGVHVFSEKPPVISEEQYHTLRTLKTDRQYGFCFQNRYNPGIQLVKRLLASGSAGRIKGARAIVTWDRNAAYYTESGWRGRLETEGGGVLINQSIHTMDLLVYLLGAPVSIEAGIQNHHLKGIIEVEDTMEAFIRFADVNAVFYATTAYCANMPPLIEIACEDRTIRIEDQAVTYFYQDGHTEKPVLCTPQSLGKDYWGSGHKSCISDFYRSIAENRTFAQNLSGVKDTVLLMLGAYKSARTRSEIRISEPAGTVTGSQA